MGHSVTKMVSEEERADDCPVYHRRSSTHWWRSRSDVRSDHFEDVVRLCTDQDQDMYHSLWCITRKCLRSRRVDRRSIACYFQLLAKVSKLGGVGLFITHDSISSRPLDMDIHLQSFTIPHYPSLMIAMSKPAYLTIVEYAPTRPVIIFVSSWRQCRLTIDDLLLHCTSDNDPNRFLNIDKADLQPP